MMTIREKELQMVKKRDIFYFEVLCENKENYKMSECTSKRVLFKRIFFIVNIYTSCKGVDLINKTMHPHSRFRYGTKCINYVISIGHPTAKIYLNHNTEWPKHCRVLSKMIRTAKSVQE
jgi:hypothetical protein